MNYCVYCNKEIKDSGVIVPDENGLLGNFHEECFIQGLFDGVVEEESNTNLIANV